MSFFRDAEQPFEPPPGDDAAHPRWEVPDLIDFDYYVEADERAKSDTAAARQSLAKRDRALYLERIKPRLRETEHTPSHRRMALRLWLAERRRSEDPPLRPLLPGASFARGQRVVTILLAIFGLITGATVASALLQYEGEHPVNVSWYILVLVILQLGLVGFTLGAWAMRRSKSMQQALRDVSLLAHLIRPLFSRVAQWIQRHRLGQMPPEVRDRAKARQGLLQSHFSLYGPASYLPMLIPVQAFGIAFNLGAISMTLLLLWFTDLAFGWGSALNIDPAVIYHLTKFIAWPWSWLFGEGAGYPTLAEIAGTRIYLKDPLSMFDAEHLRAWRWFLVLAVTSYGLLPRLAMLGLSAFIQRHALDRLPFTHQRTQALYTRLVTPDLDTGVGKTGMGPAMPIPAPLKPVTTKRSAPRGEEAPPADKETPPSEPAKATPSQADAPQPQTQPAGGRQATETGPASTPAGPAQTPNAFTAPKEPPAASPKTTPAQKTPAADGTKAAPAETSKAAPAPTPPETETPTTAPPAAETPGIAPDACVLLLHVDVADVLEDTDHGRLQQLLRQCSGWRVANSATYGGGTAMADQAVALIEDCDWGSPPARVALIDDGSQPPITERLRFLRRVRAAAGDQAQILLALTGDPDGDDPLPPVSDFDFGDWQRKIEQLADPYLRLTMLAPAAEAAPAGEVSDDQTQHNGSTDDRATDDAGAQEKER
ncbi:MULTISPECIES: DUF2868 domain-containing protein [Thiorhodovibrio]|uniref:DUF2868 domain-containing protein n=1 Tax=Thiorhodovibrio TaxID=61593 RepID=UPI0019147192|nr:MULTISPECIES: DUF2868 domain-containing protein [Thiorhodovibrio]MBK5967260.1 cell division protein [Thiorhodovibrio winogradskyi]WPL14486.1 Ribonucleases G and E [Thiorhodovibrio litoralis]